MKKSELSIPEISLIAATRVALGVGLALLLGDKLSREQRRGAGWSLFLVGAVTTVPLIRMVLEKRCSEPQEVPEEPLRMAR